MPGESMKCLIREQINLSFVCGSLPCYYADNHLLAISFSKTENLNVWGKASLVRLNGPGELRRRDGISPLSLDDKGAG